MLVIYNSSNTHVDDKYCIIEYKIKQKAETKKKFGFNKRKATKKQQSILNQFWNNHRRKDDETRKAI